MVNKKSFNDIMMEIVERKKWEKESEEKFNNATCEICKGVLSNMGRSNLVGICSICVKNSMNPTEPKPKGL